LGFGFVLAQLQAAAGMLLRQSLAQTQKSSLKTATLFLKTLWKGRTAADVTGRLGKRWRAKPIHHTGYQHFV